MSSLECFLKPEKSEEVIEVVISKRFKDEKGKPATIKIKAITEEENNAIAKKCTIKEKNQRTGIVSEHLDRSKYLAELILACVKEPNFKSEEFVTAMGTADPVEALRKLFLPGEYTALSEKVLSVVGVEDITETAKN